MSKLVIWITYYNGQYMLLLYIGIVTKYLSTINWLGDRYSGFI